MENEGYQVAEAKKRRGVFSGLRAPSQILSLLDAIIPVMDGFTCCTQLQKSLAAIRLRHRFQAALGKANAHPY